MFARVEHDPVSGVGTSRLRAPSSPLGPPERRPVRKVPRAHWSARERCESPRTARPAPGRHSVRRTIHIDSRQSSRLADRRLPAPALVPRPRPRRSPACPYARRPCEGSDAPRASRDRPPRGRPAVHPKAPLRCPPPTLWFLKPTWPLRRSATTRAFGRPTSSGLIFWPRRLSAS